MVHGLYSYGTGLPEPDCAGDNPLHYKITWTFDGVLKAYKRSSRILRDGREVAIAGGGKFSETSTATALSPRTRTAGGLSQWRRRPLHPGFWPGIRSPEHGPLCAAVSRTSALLGGDGPVGVSGRRAAAGRRRVDLSPAVLVRHLTPKLQFAANERDVIVLRVTAWGLKEGRQRRVTFQLIDYRDLNTGLFAMNRTVGYTASIAAQMILKRQITAAGVLSLPGMFLPRNCCANSMPEE